MHLNAVYDLMEERYLDVVIQKRAQINERSAFVQMVNRNSLAGKCLYVADRGYFSLNVIAHIIRADQFFLHLLPLPGKKHKPRFREAFGETDWWALLDSDQ